MEKEVQEKVDKWNEEHPNAEDGEAVELPLETQLSVITTRVGEGKGTTYRGLGRCMRREPKKRGGVSRVDVDSIVEAKVQERVAEMTAMKEEMERKMQEQQEINKQMQEQMKKQVDEAVALALAKFLESRPQLQEGTSRNDNPSPSNT